MPRPVTHPISAATCWITTIKGKLNRNVHESPKPNCAPIWLCVPIPLGSSSAAPVTRPGPSRRHRLSNGEPVRLLGASFMVLLRRGIKGVVMDVRPILIDLSKLRHPVPEPPGEEHASLASSLLLEGQFGAGKQTNGHMTIVDRGK